MDASEPVNGLARNFAAEKGQHEMAQSGREKDKVRTEIETAVRELIHSGEILRVIVDAGHDADGDDVLLVNVIYDNKGKLLDARETVSVTTIVRDRLLKIGERSFPIFSYITKSEAGKLAAAS